MKDEGDGRKKKKKKTIITRSYLAGTLRKSFAHPILHYPFIPNLLFLPSIHCLRFFLLYTYKEGDFFFLVHRRIYKRKINTEQSHAVPVWVYRCDVGNTSSNSKWFIQHE